MPDAEIWCKKNCQEQWRICSTDINEESGFYMLKDAHNYKPYAQFKSYEDAVVFKLFWNSPSK